MSYRLSPVVPATLVDLLRRRALELPGQRAFTFLEDGEAAESHLTYGELDRRPRSIAVGRRSWKGPWR